MTTERQPTLDVQLLNDVCQVLADPLRRRLLYDLIDDGHVSLREPAIFEPDGGSDEDAVRVHHQHLPMLAAASLVDWDERSGDVVATDTLERVRGLLDVVRDADPAFSR